MGIKVAFLITPPILLLLNDETNQAKCNKSSNERTENKLSNVYHIRQMKLCAANWTDLTICNKLSNKTNHVMCNK